MAADDFVHRARTLLRDGRAAEAVRVCRLGLLGQPADVEGRMVLGGALLSLGRFDEVLAEMRVVLGAQPDRQPALVLKGEALLGKGDKRQALEVLSRAKQLDPLSARVTALLDQITGPAPPPPPAFVPSTVRAPLPPPGAVVAPMAKGSEFSGQATTKGPMLSPRAGSIDMTVEPTHVPDSPSQAVEIASSDLVEDPSQVTAPPREPSAVEIASSDFVEEQSEVTMPAPLAGIGDHDEPTSVSAPRPPAALPLPAPQRALPRPLPDFGAMESSVPTGARAIGAIGLARVAMPATAPAAADDFPRLPTALGATLDALEAEGPPPRPPVTPLAVPTVARVEAARPARATVSAKPTPAAKAMSAPTAAPSGKAAPARATLPAPAVEAPRGRPAPYAKSAAEARAALADGVAERAPSPRLARPRSGPLVWVLAGMLVAGGGAAGWAWRGMRVGDRVTRSAALARADEATQTYRGLAAARERWAATARAVPDDLLVRAATARAQVTAVVEYGAPRDRVLRDVDRVADDARRDALLARAYRALALTDDAAAVASSRVAATALPDDAEANYLVGRALLQRGDADEAIAALSRAASLGHAPLAQVWLALAQAEAGRDRAALATINEAAERYPEHPAVRIAQARLAAATGTLGDKATAVRRGLEALLADDGGPVPALGPRQRAWAQLALAEVLLASGDPEASRERLKLAEDAALGDDRRFARAIFRLWLALGDVERARQAAGALARSYPMWPGATRILAELALLDGQPQAALGALGADAGPEARVLRGRARLALGELEAAAAELDAALAARPDDRDAALARATIDWKRGDAKAVKARLEPLWRSAADPEVGALLGAAQRQLGEREEARKVLERAVTSPRGQDAWLDLARVYRAEGKLTEAQEAFAKALVRAPRSVEVRLELALVAYDGGDTAAARAAVDELAAAAPKDLSVLLACARLRSAMGDARGARQCLSQAGALAKDPAQRGALAREQGRASLVGGEYNRAAGELGRTALDDGEGRLLYLDVLLLLRDDRRAAAVVAEIGKTFSGRPEADLARARVQAAAGDPEHAAATLSTAEGALASQGAPPRVLAEVRAEAARLKLEDGDLAGAERLALAATKVGEWNGAAQLVLGRVRLAQGQLKPAREALARATTLRPGDAEAWYAFADTARRLRDVPAARAAALSYLRLAPRGEHARDAKLILRLR